jgi:DNA polymerase IV
MYRAICHVDMDAFFAAVEIRADPHLAGLPLVVGGGPDGRGVVTTASYPARSFGVRSGMSVAEALARCPGLIFRPVDPAKYVHASESIIRVFETFTPAVEPASIDEAFLDLSGVVHSPEEALETARRLKSAVLRREKLTCSVGLGPNKLQAKMATALQKPDGLTQLLPGDFEKRFSSRPVQDLWGVGPESSRALGGIGLTTIGQLANARDDILARLFGVTGRVLIRMARGEGGGPVVPYYNGIPARSMGHEMTFPRDVTERRLLESHLLLLADKVARRLRREDYAGHVITVKVKWSDRTLATRQKALAVPTDQEKVILAHARILLQNHLVGADRRPTDVVPESRGTPPVRLLGVSVGHLISNRNLYPLFPEDRRERELSELKDRLRNRYGETVLMPAGVLKLFRN